MAITLYSNGQLLCTAAGESSPRPVAGALVVAGGTIRFLGAESEAIEEAESLVAVDGSQLTRIDLGGRLVVPGFIDGHAHVLGTGDALSRVALTDARDIEEIQSRLRAAHEANPDAARILGRGWLFDSVPNNAPTAAMIDAAINDVPVYLDANDYHSCWVNTAALAEMGIGPDTADPVGGEIERDAEGAPTGMLYETAASEIAWNHLNRVAEHSAEDAALDRAFTAYLEAGGTAAVDMGLGEVDLAAFERARVRHGGRLPMTIVAHWRISNTGDAVENVKQVERAIELATQDHPSGLRVAGIKCVIDGTIDACTAAMHEPYANGANSGPIWPLADLAPVVVAADAAGLQVALHAIGDDAIDIALSALEEAAAANGGSESDGQAPRRHRIEHLEYAAPGTAERMASLGITASMQPVHTDAAIRANWTELVGPERAKRGFAWPEYEEAGALLAFSTDAPTAPYAALPNLYIATTRKSALDPGLGANEPELVVGLREAFAHVTRDAAIAAGEEGRRGDLEVGLAADFAVLEANPFELGVEVLRDGRVWMTVVGGTIVHRA